MSWVYTDDYIKRKEQQALQDITSGAGVSVFLENQKQLKSTMREYWIRTYAGQALQGILGNSREIPQEIALVDLARSAIDMATLLYTNLEADLNDQK